VTRSGNAAIIRVPQRFAVAPRFMWVAMVRVIRLSDGVELSRRSYAPDSIRTVSVSADTRVWIETSTHEDGTAIDYPTGRRYALGKVGTVGFAGLPDTVLATDWDSKAKVSGIRFIDWRTGEVLGRRTVRGSGGLVAVEPGGLGLLLDSAIPQPCGEINDIEILDDSGALVQLVQQSRICPTDTPRPR
jgi:hypothetical protein